MLQSKEYCESDLIEEFKRKIGMITLNVPNQYILLPLEFSSYTIDGEIYEITASLKYWKELLKNEHCGEGYMGTLFELEKLGWKKYFSKSYLSYFLIAPDFVDEADKIIGRKDVGYAWEKLEHLVLNDDNYTYYKFKNGGMNNEM